eukprot:7426507-Pyramimonas_sp.AAC.1
MSRWAADVMLGLDTAVWWLLVDISFKVRRPWRELREHLQAHDQLVKRTGAGALAHLVWTKADSIYKNALSMQKIDAWSDVLDTVGDAYLVDAAAACCELGMASA